MLLVGDSQVRYQDRTFFERAWDRRVRVCFPGARVQDVTGRLDRHMAGTGKEWWCTSLGTMLVRSEGLGGRYRVMMVKASCRTGVVYGVLSRLFLGGEWLARVINLNCRIEGLQFVDGWDTFFSKDAIYGGTGLWGPAREGS